MTPLLPGDRPGGVPLPRVASDVPLPRLAVVMPCYNAERWIARAIGSVLAQDHPDLLVIAVDDGSTDGTLDALRAFGDAITVETGPNRGACHARNRGLALAAERGAEHVVFLDADDQFEGPILSHAAAVAVRTGADLVVSGMVTVYPQGERTERLTEAGPVTPEAAFASRLAPAPVVPGGLLWRRSFAEQVGWDESLSKFQDTDMVMRALLRRPLVMKNDTGVVLYMRDNPQSISRSTSRVHIESQLQVFSSLLEQVSGTAFTPAIPALIWKLYLTARMGFLHGQPDLARKAMRIIADNSARGVPWRWNWRMLVRLIGLQTRVRLRGHGGY